MKKTILFWCSILIFCTLSNMHAQPLNFQFIKGINPLNTELTINKSSLKSGLAEKQPVYSINSYYSYDAAGTRTDSVPNAKTDFFYTSNRLDSSIFGYYDGSSKRYMPKQKNTFLRDELNRDTFQIEYAFNEGTMLWEPSKKVHVRFDSKGRQIYNEQHDYDLELKSWTGTEFTQYAFDDYGNSTFSAKYVWDSNTQNWVGEQKVETYFNYKFISFISNDGFARDSIIVSFWNYKTKKWYVAQRQYENYNESGNYLRFLFEYKENPDSIFKPNVEVVFTLDQNGRDSFAVQRVAINAGEPLTDNVKIYFMHDSAKLSLLIQLLDTIKNKWYTIERDEYNFDVNLLKITSRAIYINDTASGNWFGYTKYRNEWADSMHASLLVNYEWNSIIKDWSVKDSSIFAYNSQGLQTKIEKYGLVQGIMKGSQNQEKVFNENGQQASILNYKWDAGKWKIRNHEIHIFNTFGNETYYEKANWNLNEDVWMASEKTWYFYTPYIDTKIQNTDYVSDIKVYPNPNKGKLFLSSKNNKVTHIEIYDMTGKSVFKQYGNTSISEVDINSLKNGLYVLRINKGQTAPISIVIQK